MIVPRKVSEPPSTGVPRQCRKVKLHCWGASVIETVTVNHDKSQFLAVNLG